MNIPIISVFFFFFLFFYFATSAEVCQKSGCGRYSTYIRFPFRIRDKQPSMCGYPGFELACDSQNQMLLTLPYSGDFTVNTIRYATQQIWIDDPNNCLPRRILSLNLSDSPFFGVYNHFYTFFNCSSNYAVFGSSPIACLSGSNYSVFASPNERLNTSLWSNCSLIKTVPVPVQWLDTDGLSAFTLDYDLRLAWSDPGCGECEIRGQKCGFKANSNKTIVCTNPAQQGTSRVARYVVSVVVGVPVALGLLGLICCLGQRIKCHVRSPTQSLNLESPVTIVPPLMKNMGLDGPTIESYAKIVLGESRRLPNIDDQTCPICLSEYKPKETLKVMPKCQHCFHADCIDEWLRLNSSCPMCRGSPSTMSPATD